MIKKRRSAMTRMLMTAGAFISYSVGAGFASGNEILQFYGSWGLPQSVYAVIGGVLATILFIIPTYWISSHSKEDEPSEAFINISGNVMGKFFQIFIYVFIGCAVFMMFSGAGTIINQELGFPKLVGAIILGVLAVIIVLGGLKTVENFLGFVGIALLGYTVVFAVVSLFHSGSDISQAQMISDGVQRGVVTRANLFDLFPFSLVPGLSSLNSGPFEGIIYAFEMVSAGFPFYYILGKRAHSNGESVASAFVTSIAYYLCISMVVICLLLNGEAIFNPDTGSMFEFPLVAVIGRIWPSGSWTYTIMIFLGILTTVVGYMYVLKDLLFHGQQEITNPIRVFYLLIVVIGVALGSRLPFSMIINILYPYAGLVGLILTVFMLIKALKIKGTPTVYEMSKKNEDDIPLNSI